MVFTQTTATNYVPVLVTSGFVNGAAFDFSAPNLQYTTIDLAYPPQTGLYQSFQQNISALRRLETEDCIRAFSAQYVTEYLNVLLVSNSNNANNSILNGWSVTATPEQNDNMNFRSDLGWLCGNQNSPCDFTKLAANATNWMLPWVDVKEVNAIASAENTEHVKVEYCLAQYIDPQCSVLLSVSILIVVIIFNAIQLLMAAWAMFMRDLVPLITTGDAVASFMATSDPTTVNSGTLSVFDVRKGLWRRKRTSEVKPVVWYPRRRRWYKAVSIRRWAITLLL